MASAFYAGAAGLDLDYDSRSDVLTIGLKLDSENPMVVAKIDRVFERSDVEAKEGKR